MGGLYAGAMTTSIGSFFSSAMYFATYESMKTYWSVIPDPHRLLCTWLPAKE